MSVQEIVLEPAEAEAATPKNRWVEPVVDDYPAFYAAHPETHLSMADIEALRSEIHHRVRLLAPYASRDQHADLEADLTLRVLEAATGTREADPLTGEPVYDYMAQKPGYIVLHASGKVSSALRRHWKEIEATVTLDAIAPHPEDGDEEGPVDVVDRATWRPTERLEHVELRDAIAAQLSNAELRVFRLLDAGLTRPEIAELLTLDRRTIHSHMAKIRKATEAVMAHRADGIDAAVLRRRTARRNSRMAIA